MNERLETTAPGVWAIGEVAGSPQFTHVSLDDFRVVHSSLTGGSRVTTGRLVPFCLFTDPEFARVGLSENEARARSVAYRVFKIPMAAVMRASTLSETRGFLKALVEADGHRILGFTGFGVGAGEILSSVQIAMLAGLPYTALRDAILTHPTLGEGLIPCSRRRLRQKSFDHNRELQIFLEDQHCVFQDHPVMRSHAHECKRQMKGTK